ncbi:DUF4252 domain-containing protein [Chitinophaga lutea]
MKRITILLFILLAGSRMASAQSTLDKFFLKYQDDPSFTLINITPKMFNMFSKLSLDDPDAKQILAVASKLKGLRILVKEDTKDAPKLFKEASQFLNGGLEELMTIRDKDADVKFMSKENAKGNIAELVMIVGSSQEFVALALFGDVSLEEISAIAGNMRIDGFENLSKLRKYGKNQ